MRPFTRLVGYFFAKRLWSLPNLLFFLLLLTVLLAGVVAMTSEQRGFARAYAATMPAGMENFSMPLTTLIAGSAHTNVWEAITYRFLHSSPSRGGILLPLRFVAKWLVFVLPLAGFILSYGAVSKEVESGVIESLFTLPIKREVITLGKVVGEAAATVVTLVVGMGMALLLATRLMNVSWNADQLARTLLFLGVMGVYTSFFILLGTWISAIVKRSSSSLWICTTLVVSLFALSTVIDNVAYINANDCPTFPQMSRDVNMYLHGLQFRSLEDPNKVPMAVADYMKELRVYEDAVAHLISSKYKTERWWNFLSPTQLALEVSGQLLQDEYRNAPDVFNIERSEETSVNVLTSLRQVGPELTWLLLLCALALAANAVTVSRMEV
jgi:ABC-type transport system involved in multi-copper enzyme maturation permease subunit